MVSLIWAFLSTIAEPSRTTLSIPLVPQIPFQACVLAPNISNLETLLHSWDACLLALAHQMAFYSIESNFKDKIYGKVTVPHIGSHVLD